jgi:hypothetical protein
MRMTYPAGVGRPSLNPAACLKRRGKDLHGTSQSLFLNVKASRGRKDGALKLPWQVKIARAVTNETLI